MSETRDERDAHPSTLLRAEEIQTQIQQLSGRDLQLWSIVILVVLVLTAGWLALVLPNLVWAQRVIHIEQGYLPQLFFGLISLVLLFNIYLLGQKLTLNATRRAINVLVPREVARANRLGSNLTFMTIDISHFRSINTKHGTVEGDRLLTDFGKMLKEVFRGGDFVFRQGGDEFLILMPDTSEEQADYPIQR